MNDEQYARLVNTLADRDALADLDPFDRVNAVKIALCEIGDVVPGSIEQVNTEDE